MLSTEHHQALHRTQCRNQAHFDWDLQPPCCLALFLERVSDRLYRGFKECCDVFTVRVSVRCMKYTKKYLYPANLSWPERISYWGSLSRTVPNLMYCGSPASRNLSFVVLSKISFICWTMSGDPYRELASLAMVECDIITVPGLRSSAYP